MSDGDFEQLTQILARKNNELALENNELKARLAIARHKQDLNNGVTGEKVTYPQAAEVAPQSVVASPPVAPEFPGTRDESKDMCVFEWHEEYLGALEWSRYLEVREGKRFEEPKRFVPYEQIAECELGLRMAAALVRIKDERIAELERELVGLKYDRDKTQSELFELEQWNAGLEVQIQSRDKRIAELEEQIVQLELRNEVRKDR